MKKVLFALLLVMVIAGTASAAQYNYVKINAKGVGYKNMEVKVDTNPTGTDYENKIALAELETGTGLVAKERYELTVYSHIDDLNNSTCKNSDYVVEKKEVDFEYMPVVYQNESYDFKWTEKKCVKDYFIGGVVDAFFTKAEKLQKTEEARANTTAVNMNVVASVAGKAHVGAKSVDPDPNEHKHVYFEGHQEWVGVFDIDSYVELRKNCSINQTPFDWLGCP